MIKSLLQTLGVILGFVLVIGGYVLGLILATSTKNGYLIQLAGLWPVFLICGGVILYLIFALIYSLFLNFDRKNRPEIYYYSSGWKRKKKEFR